MSPKGKVAVLLGERLYGQGLSGPPLKTPEAVVERILAVQAQDARGAKLAVRSRTSGLDSNDVLRAFNDGSLVVSWLNRGTLHLVTRDDYPWLHALTAPRTVTANLTRLGQEGVTPSDAEKGLRVIRKAIGDQGPMSRIELRDLLDSKGIPTKGQAFIHVLMFSSLRGWLARGPVKGTEQQFVLVEDWLGKQPKVDLEKAAAEMARRYLAGHWPATDRDLANWGGITLGQARTGLKAIASELEEGSEGQVKLKGSKAPAGMPPPKLLGPFDPVLHGWKSREFLIPAEDERAVVTTNGIFRPTILVNGQVVGIWRLAAGKLELEPFGDVSTRVRKALDIEAEDVKRFVSPDPLD